MFPSNITIVGCDTMDGICEKCRMFKKNLKKHKGQWLCDNCYMQETTPELVDERKF